MTLINDKKIKFFGCPLDCDEQFDAIREKRHFLKTAEGFDDPYDGVMSLLEADPSLAKMSSIRDGLGSFAVPEWLRPTPCADVHSQLTSENFISFIDDDGCRSMANAVDAYVTENVIPHIPLMIGVDHSLTGGVYSAVCRHYGRENVSLIIIDSHTDAVPMTVLAGAVQYDVETNPDSVHDVNNPFLYNRPDSYNASSFVDCMIKDGILDPKQLYIIGVSDFPEKKALKARDGRIKKYNNSYLGLRRKGAGIITKKECKLSPQKIKGVLKQIKTPFVYLSVDMDIGAGNALEGVRFKNRKGLNESAIYKIADLIKQRLADSVQLVGMDICEIDPRSAGLFLPAGKDRTYEIAANLIKKFIS